MTDLLSGMTAAASGMTAQSARLRIVAENIANVDTPGYRRKLISFQNMVEQGDEKRAVAAGRVSLDQTPLEEVYDPAHPLADSEGYYDGILFHRVVE